MLAGTGVGLPGGHDGFCGLASCRILVRIGLSADSWMGSCPCGSFASRSNRVVGISDPVLF